VSWILLALVIVGGLAASLRLKGFGRAVVWSTVALVGSMLFRGGRVLVLPFLFLLILEGIYWLALPPADGGRQG
jgi:hypothetical protein